MDGVHEWVKGGKCLGNRCGPRIHLTVHPPVCLPTCLSERKEGRSQVRKEDPRSQPQTRGTPPVIRGVCRGRLQTSLLQIMKTLLILRLLSGTRRYDWSRGLHLRPGTEERPLRRVDLPRPSSRPGLAVRPSRSVGSSSTSKVLPCRHPDTSPTAVDFLLTSRLCAPTARPSGSSSPVPGCSPAPPGRRPSPRASVTAAATVRRPTSPAGAVTTTVVTGRVVPV